MSNLQIAELLKNVAAAYQLKDEKNNFFKISAYQRAADAVEHATSELNDLWDEGRVEDVPGIGPSIAKHLDELFRMGKSSHFEEVMRGYSPKIFELMKVPGVGPKTALKMVEEGNIPQKIAHELKDIKEKPRRHLLPYASVIAAEIINYMKSEKSVKRIDPLGSLRRQAATVGDIDIAVATENSRTSELQIKAINHFVKYPKAQKVIENGEHTASIIVPGGVQVDLLVSNADSYGAALQHFTGSKHHNIALREYALKKGFSLSEYGIKEKGRLKKFSDEESFYKFLGLDWIPPELREDTGEIEAAKEHKLPKLVELNDVKADLQIHSSFDIETSHDLGVSSMEEIVMRSEELGYEYIAFTEHNPSRSKHTDEGIINLLKRKEEKVREKEWGIKVFNSLEVDIMPDGSLPVPEKGLETLDFVLVSIHSSFDLSKDDMTKRVLNALAHPKVKIFAHPTARKLQEREGIELDWSKIFDFCVKNNKWLEINADPMRLDLPDTLVREAVRAGVKLTLGTDVHHVDGLYNMIWGVSVARRGWCEKSDIINTLSLKEFGEVINL